VVEENAPIFEGAKNEEESHIPKEEIIGTDEQNYDNNNDSNSGDIDLPRGEETEITAAVSNEEPMHPTTSDDIVNDADQNQNHNIIEIEDDGDGDGDCIDESVYDSDRESEYSLVEETSDPYSYDTDGLHPIDQSQEDGGEGFIDDNDISKIKLQASKSPIMDALVYCALKGWGLELVEQKGDHIQFRMTDFKRYYKYSALICAKQNPTEDQASRIKALKRWFPDFPTKRAGKMDRSFLITVQKGNKRDNKPRKMREIIEKNRRLLGIKKVMRQR